jgi:hypothetical protein
MFVSLFFYIDFFYFLVKDVVQLFVVMLIR